MSGHLISFEEVKEMIDYENYDELGGALVEMEFKCKEQPSDEEYDRLCEAL